MVGHDRGQRIDQAETAVGTGQQQNAAGGTDLPAIERGGDFLLADTWQKERKRCSATLGVSTLQDGWSGCQFHGISSSMRF
jgi:hypothetical protein